MPLVKTLWKDLRAIFLVVSRDCYEKLTKLSWPAIYESFSKTDAPSLVILDINFITVPESTQKMALKSFHNVCNNCMPILLSVLSRAKTMVHRNAWKELGEKLGKYLQKNIIEFCIGKLSFFFSLKILFYLKRFPFI